MSGLQVTDIAVPELLKKLKRGEWLVPQFQRELVWGVPDVIDLVVSIFEARPIGMATLWEQPDQTELPLEPLSVPDEPGESQRKLKYFGSLAARPAKVYAILDGKQRCTAIAMAFGGLRPTSNQFKFSGRFYLNVATDDPTQRVIFFRESDLRRRRLDTEAACIGAGYFPLHSQIEDEEIFGQWMRYLQAIRSPQHYKDGVLPEPDELNRRDKILKECFQGLVDTKLAVYIVPPNYSLGDICDIFEKLNTTGTKVSTVDLIHSWVYSDTISSTTAPILLRDWMDELGQQDGAVGWASSKDRPELVAQIATACYIAGDTKSPPRRLGAGGGTVATIKSGDLLAVPTAHWRVITANTQLLSEIIRDFQYIVAGGLFPYTSCPYPAVVAIYVGLRWHHYFDQSASADKPWGRAELDSLYRSFFWRNALINRYDQGFLSKLGTDLRALRQILDSRSRFVNINEWAASAAAQLDKYIHDPSQAQLPSEEDLFEELTDGRPIGARLRTFTLPMIAMAKTDLIDPNISLRYPVGEAAELHHIYPRAWCSNSKSGRLKPVLDETLAGKDWVNAVANLMPLSRQSNNKWKIALPGQVIDQYTLDYDRLKERLASVFIDRYSFELLRKGADGIPEFWEIRGRLLAKDLVVRAGLEL